MRIGKSAERLMNEVGDSVWHELTACPRDSLQKHRGTYLRIRALTENGVRLFAEERLVSMTVHDLMIGCADGLRKRLWAMRRNDE